MANIKDLIGIGGKERFMIGIDLTDSFSHVCYSVTESMPESLPAGDQRLSIPTVLAKRIGENSWVHGVEAVELAQAGDAVPVDHLLARAMSGESVQVEDMDYEPTDLLALFLRKCLGRLGTVAPIEKVTAIVLTVRDPNERMVAILTDVIRILRLKKERVFIQSHSESGFYYILHQPRELVANEVCVCEMAQEGLDVGLYHENFHKKPHVMLLDEKHFKDFRPMTFPGGDKGEGMRHQMDQEFRTILFGMLEGHNVTTVYLVGDGFNGEWMDESLQYICRSSRAFLGNTLFAKGACYSAMDRVDNEEEPSVVFLGKDKIRCNLGMRVVRDGAESRLNLLEAGKNWYDCVKECDLFIDTIKSLPILVSPLDGQQVHTEFISLEGLPVRGEHATRIHLEIRMVSESRAFVRVTDLGFGEFFPPSGMVWEHEFYV